jgi:hypothetical protein
MGAVSRFDLGEFVQTYGLAYFIETGTGSGDSLAHAAGIKPAFKALRSCEIEQNLAKAAGQRFLSDHRVCVFTDRSSNFLRWACRMLPADEPAFFWLDAHFPGADYGLRGYADESDDTTRLPLAEELAIIARHRTGHDIVAVDDLRIFVDGPYGSGNLPDELRPACPKRRDIDFVHDIMGLSHTVTPLFEHEGYILLMPKGSTRDA